MLRIVATALSLFILADAANAQGPVCKRGAQEFNDGATVCECPSLLGNAELGGSARITSQRYVCSQGAWRRVQEDPCVDVTFYKNAAAAMSVYARLQKRFCQQLPNDDDDD
jgi:hypothetical protein